MKYVEYKPEYENEIVELLNICFPERKIIKDSFRWKHFPYLNGKSSVSYFALDGKKVAAFVCFVPVEVVFEDRVTLFYSCSVQATHPEYRRRGIVTILTQLAEKEIGENSNYFGFSNSSGVQIDLHSKKINYTILGRLKTLYFATYKGFFHLQRRKFGYKEITKVIKYSGNQSQILKSESYIKWKFVNNPKRKYHFLMLTKEGENAGLLIYTKSRLKIELHEILLSDKYSVKEFFSSIIEFAFNEGAAVLSFTVLMNDFWKDNLPVPTFRKNTDIYFTVKSLKKELLNKENWNIQGGDIQ